MAEQLEKERRQAARPPAREGEGEVQGKRDGDGDADAGRPAKQGEEGEASAQQDGDDGAPADDGPQQPSPLRKTWVRVLIGVAVLLLLAVGGGWLFHYLTRGRYIESTDNAYLQADQVVVESEVAGTVLEVFVADNQAVHAGQPLVRLDAASSRARVAQAEALVAQGRAGIEGYEAQIREQQAAIAQADAQVDAAAARRRYAAGEVQRYRPLAATGAEPAEKLAQVVSQLDENDATLRQSRAAATQAARHIGSLRAQIALAQAQVAQAQAQARQARVDVDSALIVASIDGRVGDRQVRVGQSAQVGTRLMTVVPVQSLYLVANFKETQLGLMRVGQPATITVDAMKGQTLDGRVESFAPATGAQFALIPPNNATGNFTKIVQRVPVRISVNAGPEARRVLLPGLSAEVAVDTLGASDDQDREQRESSAGAAARDARHRDSVQRDRQQPASGAGQ
jgi:membrane fusion protein (multidrug efflux system)